MLSFFHSGTSYYGWPLMRITFSISKLLPVCVLLLCASIATAQDTTTPQAPSTALTPQQVADKIAALHAAHQQQQQEQQQQQYVPQPPASNPIVPATPEAKPSAAMPLAAASAATPQVQDIPPATPQSTEAKPAAVSYNDGRLSVAADNSSLTDILHSIAHTTGMKITGAPAEQRVYGNYGPAAPLAVLQALLDGCGCNFIFTRRDSPAGEFIISADTTGAPKPADTTTTPVVASQPTQGVTPGGLTTQPPAPNGILTPQQVQDRIASMRARQQRMQQPQDQNPPSQQ